MADVENRYRVEDASRQTFEAYVSLNTELNHKFGSHGNSPSPGRNKWNSVDVKDMANNSDFVNVGEAEVALLERVDSNSPLDERNMDHYDHDASYTQDYPHCKTMAGALQTDLPLWQLEKRLSYMRNMTFISGLLGLGLLLA